ncbi:hypothetical protein RLW55_12015 [Hyphomicrobium sp. B1]|jgi:hypothetical protein|uniref:hypothetical protein n=1 Tax=Hyphomicrobium sp. B1 TaxID=3075651 RepID=UPI003C2FC35B
MPKIVRDVLGALFIGLFCSLTVFSLGAVFGADQPQQQPQPCAQYSQEDNKRLLGETFRERLTSDPVAFFTLWLTVFTAVLAISTIGLWIVTWRASVAQARDMDRSIKATADSADAAKKSAEVAERSLHELNRAFVFFKRIAFEEESGKGMNVVVTWENIGNTQTVQMRSAITWQAFPPAIWSGFNYPNAAPGGPSSIGPKGTRTMLPVLIPEANLREVLAGRARILAYGWTEYDDIFAQVAHTDRHRTEFCMEVLVRLQPGGSGMIVSDRTHTEYNGAERECGQRFRDAQRLRPRLAEAEILEQPDTLVATATTGPRPETTEN